MRNDDPWHIWLALGFCAGFAGTGLVAFCLLWSETTNLLTQYQTLVSGMVALVAAALAGWPVLKQVAQSKQQEEDRRARRYRSAKAVLPLALMQISAYAKKCIS